MLDRSGPDAPLTPSNSSLFASDPGESPGMLAGALSTPVAPGHFDEMHGVAMRPSAGPAPGASAAPKAARILRGSGSFILIQIIYSEKKAEILPGTLSSQFFINALVPALQHGESGSLGV